MNPIGSAALLEDELIKDPSTPISDIQQYHRHADHHLRPVAVYIHRASRQVIAPLRASALPIHLLTPIPAVDNDGNLVLSL